jgi:hypothetical protein
MRAKSGQRIAKVIRAEIAIFAIYWREEASGNRIATIRSAQIPVITNNRNVRHIAIDAHIYRALISIIGIYRIGITKSIQYLTIINSAQVPIFTINRIVTTLTVIAGVGSA